MFWRILVLTLLIPSYAAAQALPAIPPGDDKIERLELSQPAPYPGMLFDYDTALRWGNWLKQYKLRLKVDVEAEKERCQVRLDAADKTLDLHVDTHRKVEADLRKNVLRLEKQNVALQEELRNPSWYNTRTFGVVVGVVSTAGIVALSAYLVSSIP